MNRNIRFCLIILIIVFILSGCKQDANIGGDKLIYDDNSNVDLEKLNNYNIEVALDEEDKSYIGKQWTTYVNNTGKILGEVYFHLYPNAFKSLDTAPILFENKRDTGTYLKGYIDINKISSEEKELDFNIQGEGETTLKIKLHKPLLPGEKRDIYLEYKGKLPTANERFGYGDRFMNLGNWYPIACVYDRKGWNLDPYYKLGDPFYSDVGNYNLTINVDKSTIVAASGNIIYEEIIQDRKVYKIEANLIRDFAWVASPDFKTSEKNLGDTRIKLYHLDENPIMVRHSLKVGKNALKTFNNIFGSYPYDTYSIVMTEFPTGMEYPGLVFIGNDYFKLHLSKILEQIIVHETAHQWWYGLVGNDQVDEAWLDEALATYSEVVYYKEVYNSKTGEDYFMQNIQIGYEYGENYLLGNKIVNKQLKDFYNWDDYGILVYIKGAMFINEIKSIYGEEALYKILNTYFNKFKYKNATTEDFIKVCEEVTKSNFSKLTDKWLYN